MLFREPPDGARRWALLVKAIPERAIEFASMSPRLLAVIKEAFY
jgi:hypothetical protein